MTGGWTLGTRIDGTQVGYVRVRDPSYVAFIAIAMLGTSLTGLEYGLLGANIQTGGSLTTRLYNPTLIVDLGETHLATTCKLRVHVTLSRNPWT
ncbi:hypothetical protein N7455_003971 [Penicillium solitum]|uniref:uncharacterized protein n=1 Tax=Penicillium solitum TaxID=60172 RepID=UPI00181A3C92|nr:hypothetical protein HAV15_003516 [Penicillium sp. str. \